MLLVPHIASQGRRSDALKPQPCPSLAQVGKVLGAKVVAVARGPAKVALLEELGADLVLDSASLKLPLRAAVKEIAPKGGWLPVKQRSGLMTNLGIEL